MLNFIHQREFFPISVYMCLCKMQGNHMNNIYLHQRLNGPLLQSPKYTRFFFFKSRIPEKLTKIQITHPSSNVSCKSVWWLVCQHHYKNKLDIKNK